MYVLLIFVCPFVLFLLARLCCLFFDIRILIYPFGIFKLLSFLWSTPHNIICIHDHKWYTNVRGFPGSYKTNKYLTPYNIQTLYVKHSRFYHVSTIMLFHSFLSARKELSTNLNKLTKGNNKITVLRTIFQRERQNS